MEFGAREEVVWLLCFFSLFVNLVSSYVLHLSLLSLSLLFLRSNWKLRMIMVGTNEREGPRLPESLIGLALPRLMIPISESFVYLHLRFICIFGLYTPFHIFGVFCLFVWSLMWQRQPRAWGGQTGITRVTTFHHKWCQSPLKLPGWSKSWLQNIALREVHSYF